MKWYHWVGICVLFAVVLLLWLMTGGKGPNPMVVAQREIDVVNAKADAKKAKAELGYEKAVAHVQAKYAEDIEAMDAARRKRADEISGDPAKLAAFIVRGKT